MRSLSCIHTNNIPNEFEVEKDQESSLFFTALRRHSEDRVNSINLLSPYKSLKFLIKAFYTII